MRSVLIVDNLSPFTQEIERYLQSLGADHSRVTYSDLRSANLDDYKSFVLSGRRRNSREINSINARIVRHCANTGVPLLGICYGAEIIALALGGTIKRMSEHVQGQMTVDIKSANNLTGDRDSLSVYESHAYCIARLPPDFVSLARSKSCEHEIIAHRRLPIFGTQFHPEKSGLDGEDLLQRFTSIKHEGFYLQERKS